MTHGVVHCDRVDSRLSRFLAAAGHRDAAHYWVVVGDKVFDITADQFNYRLDTERFPAVLIAPADTLVRHRACGQTEPFVPEDGDWPTAFSREQARAAADAE